MRPALLRRLYVDHYLISRDIVGICWGRETRVYKTVSTRKEGDPGTRLMFRYIIRMQRVPMSVMRTV